MAPEGGPAHYLVESDFLFGLRKSDEHHNSVIRALGKHRRGQLSLTVASSSVFEACSVLHSRDIDLQTIEDALSLMGSILAEFGVRNFSGLTLSDAVLAERIRIQYPLLSFFDSLHASIAERSKIPILTSERIYSKIGVRSKDLDSI